MDTMHELGEQLTGTLELELTHEDKLDEGPSHSSAIPNACDGCSAEIPHIIIPPLLDEEEIRYEAIQIHDEADASNSLSLEAWDPDSIPNSRSSDSWDALGSPENSCAGEILLAAHLSPQSGRMRNSFPLSDSALPTSFDISAEISPIPSDSSDVFHTPDLSNWDSEEGVSCLLTTSSSLRDACLEQTHSSTDPLDSFADVPAVDTGTDLNLEEASIPEKDVFELQPTPSEAPSSRTNINDTEDCIQSEDVEELPHDLSLLVAVLDPLFHETSVPVGVLLDEIARPHCNTSDADKVAPSTTADTNLTDRLNEITQDSRVDESDFDTLNAEHLPPIALPSPNRHTADRPNWALAPEDRGLLRTPPKKLSKTERRRDSRRRTYKEKDSHMATSISLPLIITEGPTHVPDSLTFDRSPQENEVLLPNHADALALSATLDGRSPSPASKSRCHSPEVAEVEGSTGVDDLVEEDQVCTGVYSVDTLLTGQHSSIELLGRNSLHNVLSLEDIPTALPTVTLSESNSRGVQGSVARELPPAMSQSSPPSSIPTFEHPMSARGFRKRPHAHIPFRGGNPEVGKKPGVVVRRVDVDSDGFEPFQEVIQQVERIRPMLVQPVDVGSDSFDPFQDAIHQVERNAIARAMLEEENPFVARHCNDGYLTTKHQSMHAVDENSDATRGNILATSTTTRPGLSKSYSLSSWPSVSEELQFHATAREPLLWMGGRHDSSFSIFPGILPSGDENIDGVNRSLGPVRATPAAEGITTLQEKLDIRTFEDSMPQDEGKAKVNLPTHSSIPVLTRSHSYNVSTTSASGASGYSFSRRDVAHTRGSGGNAHLGNISFPPVLEHRSQPPLPARGNYNRRIYSEPLDLDNKRKAKEMPPRMNLTAQQAAVQLLSVPAVAEDPSAAYHAHRSLLQPPNEYPFPVMVRAPSFNRHPSEIYGRDMRAQDKPGHTNDTGVQLDPKIFGEQFVGDNPFMEGSAGWNGRYGLGFVQPQTGPKASHQHSLRRTSGPSTSRPLSVDIHGASQDYFQHEILNHSGDRAKGSYPQRIRR